MATRSRVRHATSAEGLAVGTRVRVRSEHFTGECVGVVAAAEYDDGWLYRIDIADGDQLDAHREEGGELWVCDFEVQPRD